MRNFRLGRDGLKSIILSENGAQHLTSAGSKGGCRGGSFRLWHFDKSGATTGVAEANGFEARPATPYSPPRPISMSLLSNLLLLPSDGVVLALHEIILRDSRGSKQNK
ncbi:hypothetical protein F8388_023947 [Cannabis sativa]|uniref:Uncharacterized protein n=1 Tax=Cannabis sativa TaxID=3483 RepID=A0A7J6HS72_CANSA|nr:hypothetical protein F8388_023947 [Cannabis sativa]KAF4398134.1 hypothetical protein G4B88_019855 [Cannabis sativa]